MSVLPVVQAPDVELWLAAYLRDVLATVDAPYATGVFVGRSVPNPRRTRMVVLRRDGGPRLDTVREAARVSAQVWAGVEQDASDLAALVAALIVACPDGAPVVAARQQSGPSSVADPSGQPARVATFELIVRGTQIVDL